MPAQVAAAMPIGSVVSGMAEDLSAARDRQLVRRIEGGDEEAFRSLFATYAPSAMALAVRVVRQTQLAEEIVQEAFLTLWRSPGVFDERRGSVKAWLMTMVHHRAVDVVRREEAQRRRSARNAGPRPLRARVRSGLRTASARYARRAARGW